MQDTNGQEKQDLTKAMLENIAPRTISIERGDRDGAGVLVVPKGMTVVSVKNYLDEYRTAPARRSGTEKTDRLHSFIDMTERFKNEDSVIFAKGEINGHSLTANLVTVFDYHPANGNNEDAKNCQHRAFYNFPVSKEFAFWLKGNAEPLSQTEFALLLEERIGEMVVAEENDFSRIANLTPKFAEPLEILELARNLQIYSNETVQQAGKLSTGEREIKFSAVHTAHGKDGKPITVPDFFMLHIPIFAGEAAIRIAVRLRYRKSGEQVIWFYDLYRVDQIFQEAFDFAIEYVKQTTGLPLFMGTPAQ